ncbi:NtaA/DmoA family FMN-dependent monooxygenase [Leucobacter celer]|uniref:NtaA/DmoA family FMN-dependent monooxygenase n=1 Tax=Leucobacter celer TaxID=668625 RepID=UPI0006A7DC5B|nr:NtaA/DmoA family FMN-dependent monooxygenase [Leucobacter celer]
MTRSRLLFNGFTQLVPSHLTHGLWRSPWGRTHNFNDLDTWIDIARTLEDAKFDGLFFADHLGIGGKYADSYDIHVQQGICFPDNDAVVLASALIAVTSNLSLSFTSSLIQNHPFEFARLASTVDHLSKGRAGWNIVTSALENSYKNVGFAEIPTHAERYARADEFLDVVYKLWEGSWADDAVQRDIERGVYADPGKVFKINHSGPLYSVEGPHLSEPSPQKVPFLYTAGMSESAHRLAAKHAEGLLINANGPEKGASVVARIGTYLAEYGRERGDLKIFQNLKFVVGSTEEEAQRKYEELLSWVHPAGAAAQAGGVLGFDLGKYDPDEPLDVEQASGFLGTFGAAAFAPGQTHTTINKILSQSGTAPIVGTPEQIADEIEAWADAGVDGINVADYLFHGSFHDFTDQVTPILQDRGLAQREYAPGTFRDKAFGAGPHLNKRHPAAAYRGAFTENLH